jgi:Ran GTPase-activating protein (RanGAP) involved in mRNA processing and transport
LQENPSLTHLHLSDCGIELEGWRALASVLPENTMLKHLDLSQCDDLDDDACTAISSCMEQNVGLKTLQLYNDNRASKVTSRGVAALFRMLESNTTLECLEISYHGNDSSGFKAVAEALSRNDSLRKLYLENHGEGVETAGVVAIGKTLETENTGLEQIAIIYDGADDDGVIALAQAMQKSSSLKHFTFNKIEYRSHK